MIKCLKLNVQDKKSIIKIISNLNIIYQSDKIWNKYILVNTIRWIGGWIGSWKGCVKKRKCWFENRIG